MTERNITLDSLRQVDAEKVHAVRGECKSRTLVFTLCHGGRMIVLTDEMTIILRARIDGYTYIDSCKVRDGRAVCTLKSSFTHKAGIFPMEISVYKGSGENMQMLFCTGLELEVEDSIKDDNEIISIDRYAALETLINRAEDAARRVESILEENAGITAGYGINIEGGVISLALADGEGISY